jgi:hypothetical protein
MQCIICGFFNFFFSYTKNYKYFSLAHLCKISYLFCTHTLSITKLANTRPCELVAVLAIDSNIYKQLDNDFIMSNDDISQQSAQVEIFIFC